MCVIIDADVAALVFRDPPDPDFLPVSMWLRRPLGDGMLAYGGPLTRQLFRVARAQVAILELDRAGRATRFPDQAVEAQEQRVKKLRLCKSDDPQVIALAIVSGARTLCSRDTDLHEDFKNKRLIDKPRGRVYQNPAHKGHLTHTSSCRQQLKKLASGCL